jgi:hypothetical protein
MKRTFLIPVSADALAVSESFSTTTEELGLVSPFILGDTKKSNRFIAIPQWPRT